MTTTTNSDDSDRHLIDDENDLTTADNPDARDSTIYIIDSHCANRLRGLLEQFLGVFNEALARRRYDQPEQADFGIEEADMIANVSSFKQQLLDDIF